MKVVVLCPLLPWSEDSTSLLEHKAEELKQVSSVIFMLNVYYSSGGKSFTGVIRRAPSFIGVSFRAQQ